MNHSRHVLLALASIVLLSINSCELIEKPNSDAPKLGNTLTIDSKSDRFARFSEELAMLVDPSTGKIPDDMRQKELDFLSQMDVVPPKGLLNDDWVSRGPYNVGGRTRTLVMDRTNEDILMAGAASGGVWRSEDGGESWNKVSSNAENLIVTCLIQDPRDGHETEWYYGTGELFGASQSAPGAFFVGAGIYRSLDNGANWESLPGSFVSGPNFTSSWQGIWNIAIDPSNQDTTEIYAATYGNIRRSINEGASFQIVLDSDNTSGTSYFTDVHVNEDGVVYATASREEEIISFGLGPNGGIHRSENGIDFTNILPVDFHSAYSRIVMAEDPSDQDRMMFLVANTDSTSGYLGEFFNGGVQYYGLWEYQYLSGDGSGAGGQWTDLSQNLPDGEGPFDDFYAQSGYDLCIAIKPDDPNTVLVGGTNLYRSTDGFTTDLNTTQIGGYGVGSDFPDFEIYEGHHPDIHGFDFLPSDPNVLVNVTDGGIFRTDDVNADTVSWASLNNGYITTQIYGLGINRNNTDSIIIAGLQDNGNFFVNGADPDSDWFQTINGDGCYTQFASDGSFALLSIQNGRIFKVNLADDGSVNAYSRLDPDVDSDPYEFIHPYALDPNDDDLLYHPYGNKLQVNTTLTTLPLDDSYEPTDEGWITLNDTLDDARRFTAISATEGPSHRVYLGTNSRNIYRVDDASDINSPLVDITQATLPNGHVDCLAVDPLNDDRLIAVYTNYGVYSLWLSEDAGGSWEKIAGSLEQTLSGGGNGPSCRWARIHPLPGGGYQYFVGTSIGLFTTDFLDGHETNWYQVAGSLIGSNVVSFVDSRMTDNLVVVGSHGGGVFSARIDQVVSAAEQPIHPMMDIYPNPSSEMVTFVLDGFTSEKEIEVYDSTGKLVMTTTCRAKSIEIDLAQWHNGLYHVLVIGDGQRGSSTFVVSK